MTFSRSVITFSFTVFVCHIESIELLDIVQFLTIFCDCMIWIQRKKKEKSVMISADASFCVYIRTCCMSDHFIIRFCVCLFLYLANILADNYDWIGSAHHSVSICLCFSHTRTFVFNLCCLISDICGVVDFIYLAMQYCFWAVLFMFSFCFQ